MTASNSIGDFADRLHAVSEMRRLPALFGEEGRRRAQDESLSTDGYGLENKFAYVVASETA